MVNKLETYLDFAENDYQHFKFCYKATLVTNQMGAIAQGICEKYLKHVIEEYVIVDNAQKNGEKEKILRTHSLAKLLRYVEENISDFQIEGRKLRIIDGFYFTARYPGEESISINEQDVEDCNDAVEECRGKVMEYIEKNKALRKENAIQNEIISKQLPAKPKRKTR